MTLYGLEISKHANDLPLLRDNAIFIPRKDFLDLCGPLIINKDFGGRMPRPIMSAGGID
jgi:hypothetical protein